MNIDSQPYEKLVIYNITKTTKEKFLTDHVYIGNNNVPKWADGYLIYFYVPSDTEFIQKMEHEKHTLIWTALEYCEMKTHEPIIKNGKDNSGCRVTDMTNDNTFKALVRFLKERDSHK